MIRQARRDLVLLGWTRSDEDKQDGRGAVLHGLPQTGTATQVRHGWARSGETGTGTDCSGNAGGERIEADGAEQTEVEQSGRRGRTRP